MSKPSVAVLKITLDDVEPNVMRRIVVPADIRLDRLHLVIQAAMGWTNSHLYEFRIGGAGWGEPDPDGFYDGPLDAKKGRLSAVLADAGRKTFSYLYDFGDGWSHTVKLEKIAPAIEGESDVLLLDAVGRCPPEDCGGAPGYERAAGNPRRSRPRGARRNAHVVRGPVRSCSRQPSRPGRRNRPSRSPLGSPFTRGPEVQNLICGRHRARTPRRSRHKARPRACARNMPLTPSYREGDVPQRTEHSYNKLCR